MQPEASLAIAKMPASAPRAVDIQQPTAAKIEVDVPISLSTDADLPTVPDSVLSARRSAEVGSVESHYTGRRGTSIKNPREAADVGRRKRAKETGAGQDPGSGVTENGRRARQLNLLAASLVN